MPLDQAGFVIIEDDAVVKALVGAREYLRTHRWCRNALDKRAKDGTVYAVCALGALRRGNPDVSRVPGERELRRAIGDGQPIGDWNDFVARSKADVLRLYDRAIELRRREIGE